MFSVGTVNGLYKYDEKKQFRSIFDAHSAYNVMIFGLIEDDANNLWISFQEGIVEVNGKDENSFSVKIMDH